MKTVDSLTPIERSAYDEGWHDGVKEGITRGVNMMVDKCKPVMRALWLARADRALMALEYFTLNCRWFKDYLKTEPPQCDVSMIKKWACVNRKCRAYADKFKEE